MRKISNGNFENPGGKIHTEDFRCKGVLDTRIIFMKSHMNRNYNVTSDCMQALAPLWLFWRLFGGFTARLILRLLFSHANYPKQA